MINESPARSKYQQSVALSDGEISNEDERIQLKCNSNCKQRRLPKSGQKIITLEYVESIRRLARLQYGSWNTMKACPARNTRTNA
nr:AlNc14C682G12399 [Albugo laibachii Nc14]|eukprot:CCA27790.1 AlNc14C682G12399 [Albugo laibachii Nc14]